MKFNRIKLLCLAISLGFNLAIWQTAEVKLADSIAKLSASLFGRSFQETIITDKQGVPVTCIPGIGKVYDPQPIAMEANRLYKTRIEPARQEAFLKLSERLEQSLDTSGMIKQPYDFPKARLKEPWYNAPSQAATMVALANRAGHLRSPETFLKARFMLEKLKPESGELSARLPEGGIWFWEFGKDDYSLKGMLRTLISLKEYNRLVGDSLSKNLFDQGILAVDKRLPRLQKNGWLNDRYHLKNVRSEHWELVGLLQSVNELTADSLFTPVIGQLGKSYDRFILVQLLERPGFGRIFSFLFAWLLLYLIAYLSLKPRSHRSKFSEYDGSQ